eukprot:GHVT01055915.1.p1 GENE.GHVT01055915.1~~GHVT01055915.1.p1  ORF type:complete len:217 (-),score=4.53 GHVT01055915.1:137-787(-)
MVLNKALSDELEARPLKHVASISSRLRGQPHLRQHRKIRRHHIPFNYCVLAATSVALLAGCSVIVHHCMRSARNNVAGEARVLPLTTSAPPSVETPVNSSVGSPLVAGLVEPSKIFGPSSVSDPAFKILTDQPLSFQIDTPKDYGCYGSDYKRRIFHGSYAAMAVFLIMFVLSIVGGATGPTNDMIPWAITAGAGLCTCSQILSACVLQRRTIHTE